MSNPEPPPDPQAVYLARCKAIEDAIAALPAPARAFVLTHLGAVTQVDRLGACHMEYVLDFVQDTADLAYTLLSLPAYRSPKVADQTHRGKGL